MSLSSYFGRNENIKRTPDCSRRSPIVVQRLSDKSCLDKYKCTQCVRCRRTKFLTVWIYHPHSEVAARGSKRSQNPVRPSCSLRDASLYAMRA